MSYNKHIWVNNVDAVDETKMNNIENGIANAVEKTGDTLTGELLFKNTDEYAAIRKTRTLNGTDYHLTVGLGTNGSARMEYVDNSKVLGSIEVRSNGLYNGVTNKKIAEQSNGWTDATKTSAIGGIVKYTKIGNIVIVTFDDITIKSNLNHGTILVSGLPASTNYQRTLLLAFSNSVTPLRVAINESGQIINHYSGLTANNNNYYGTLIYVTNE